ncbi:MAG: hypothetical protein J6B91_05225 [Prevotella sp.]|nr:hypothetical protein [Prevotella sp.]
MRKLIFCFSFVCAGLMTSCVDKNELVDEESLPGWLGSSIYSELEHPDPAKGLVGSFNIYLRLVRDLGYAETLDRTGSKTVFPANDEAFARFFESETWPGVRRYEDLSEAQKKMLLYSSMLDNAILVGMLSNTPNASNDGVSQGRALKHSTSAEAIDTITAYAPAVGSNGVIAYGDKNTNWLPFTNGIYCVSDATKPMLVHFTREYMLNNGITTAGENNDFSIITGGNYSEGDAYVFGNRMLAQDVTCQNGYIHQVENVVVPPGNMAELLRSSSDMTIISHMLDRFAVPVYNSKVTDDYHDWYKAQSEIRDMNGVANPDSIFEVRYQSRLSQGNATFDLDVNNLPAASKDSLLNLDPGWNGFYIAPAGNNSANTDNTLVDLAAMFVPDDETIKEYFTTPGQGKTLLDTYGKLPNTPENVIKNIDDVPKNVIAKFLSNLMKTSFSQSVPSKFNSVIDDAKDMMGLSLASLKDKGTGKDVRIANNGVIYVTKEVFSPKAYVCVSAPALFNLDMKMANWIIQNVSYQNPYALNLDYYAYLLTMASNYGLFLPTDKAFDAYYLDPASLGHESGTQVYHYYSKPATRLGDPGIGVSIFKYDMATGTVSEDSTELEINGAASTANFPVVRTHLADIIQYCTVVLKSGEKLGVNKYYKTKHGGAIKIEGDITSANGATVSSGSQLAGITPKSTVTEIFSQANGTSYAIDHLIQGPTQSVYSVLKNNSQFREFFELCDGFDPDILAWVGITTEKNSTGIRPIDQYKLFHVPGEYNGQKRCLDKNVKLFNNYNYTVYAPNNDAMEFAYSHGLPKWSTIRPDGTPDPQEGEIVYIFNMYKDEADQESDAVLMAKAEVLAKIEAIKSFVRYHFQNTSIFADNEVEGGNFLTFLVNSDQISQSLGISGGGGKIRITDASGKEKVIDANSSALVNEMTRDFEFDKTATEATYATSSSFAVVHELSEPLSYNREVDYSVGMTTSSAKKRK